jgi:hypothetical protein
VVSLCLNTSLKAGIEVLGTINPPCRDILTGTSTERMNYLVDMLRPISNEIHCISKLKVKFHSVWILLWAISTDEFSKLSLTCIRETHEPQTLAKLVYIAL